MRIPSSLVLLAGAAALAACGGNLVVDGTGGTTGAASSSSSSSGTGECAPFPGVGAFCLVPGQVCPVPGACCSGQAICMDEAWTFIASQCGEACSMPCNFGSFSCAPGQVCVGLDGESPVYQCAAAPCPGALDCTCAEPICAAANKTCNEIQNGYVVFCG